MKLTVYPEFLQKITSFQLTTKKLTLLKKLAIIITSSLQSVQNSQNNIVDSLQAGMLKIPRFTTNNRQLRFKNFFLKLIIGYCLFPNGEL